MINKKFGKYEILVKIKKKLTLYVNYFFTNTYINSYLKGFCKLFPDYNKTKIFYPFCV